ncbi:MAG TPA: hypothetical protein VLW51_01925 [Solirubrobacteraceae bacterium]|nr:hypothetical protein [Solirubrobacteraceae bacterium]
MGRAFAANERSYEAPEHPVMAVCADGWDPRYVDDALERGLMPRLADALANGGTYVIGASPGPDLHQPEQRHDRDRRVGRAQRHRRHHVGSEVQVTDPSFLRAVTIHAAAHAAGVPALCVTAKDKLRRLLADVGVPSFSAECAHEQALPDRTPLVDVLGVPNPGIYDWQLSPYAIDLAVAISRRLGCLLVYVSLTDFVQHSAAPGEAVSDAFHTAVNAALGRAVDAGFVVGLAADHGRRAKTAADGTPNVRFLDDALAAAGVSGGHTLCPITDPYVVHHAALGSLAWVHLDDLAERDRARGALASLPGVEGVLDRFAAAASFELPADRIGDLVVLGDERTVLGKSGAAHGLGSLNGRLRSHGGLHERDVPIIIFQPLEPRCVAGRDLYNRDLHDLLLNHLA